MSWYTYILLCDEKTFYIGISDDLQRRLHQHQNKESFYTKKFSQVKLVYQEEYVKWGDAEKREQQLKKWSVAKKKALIEGNKNLLRRLSKGSEVDDRPEAGNKW